MSIQRNQLRVIGALRGLGTLLVLTCETRASSRVYAPPGVHLPGTADLEGWREGTWRHGPHGTVSFLECARASDYQRVTMCDIVDAYISVDNRERDRGRDWAQAAWDAAVAGSVWVLRPGTTASASLRIGALALLDEALLDAARAWGDEWVRARLDPEVASRLSELRRLVPPGHAVESRTRGVLCVGREDQRRERLWLSHPGEGAGVAPRRIT
jgi:hypothetical protein